MKFFKILKGGSGCYYSTQTNNTSVLIKETDKLICLGPSKNRNQRLLLKGRYQYLNLNSLEQADLKPGWVEEIKG
jgi:hypothetical protein